VVVWGSLTLAQSLMRAGLVDECQLYLCPNVLGAGKNFKDLVLRARSAPGCLDFAITADPVDSNRINNFEFWQSEKDLNSWRAVSNPPKEITPMLRMEVQKHVIQQSGPPF
jgi:RibD C-terminal domain/Antibiotic biosynthesis monooxygenase